MPVNTQLETMVRQTTAGTLLARPGAGRAAPADAAHAQLLQNYHDLIRERAIPRPAAFQFLKELGHGRQGVVFLAARHGPRGCVTHHALKLFDPGIYASAAAFEHDMERIARQVSRLQPLNNSNLVALDYYEECDGIGFVLMQAVDGVDLQYLLDGQHLNQARARSSNEEWEDFFRALFRQDGQRFSLQPGAALYILRNVLRGLAALHAQGFIHGDIKPTNIMLNIQGAVKLVDFGRAARVGEPVNILLGSPLYMAPEIHRREPGQVQSDLFSAGLVGLEMLRGRQVNALGELNENQLLDWKLTLGGEIEKWLPPEVLNNIELTRVLKKILAAEAVDRFDSALQAESGNHSLLSARQWMNERERETEYERKIEAYLAKLTDPATGTLNPHFAVDNLTAVILA